VGHKHTKGEILEGALAASFDDGLSQLTFGRLAKRLGISDRVIVYYFPSKDDLISEVVLAMGVELQQTLAEAFTEIASDHTALLQAAWPVLAVESSDRVFALFFEANGLAAAGRDPYQEIVPSLVEGWISWAAEFIEGTTEQRRIEAETGIAVLDGLLLLRLLAGAEAADRAAHRLGIR